MKVMLPLLKDALKLMQDCECADGCYCCVHTTKCTEYNAGTDKRSAIAVAKLILAAAATPPASNAATGSALPRAANVSKHGAQDADLTDAASRGLDDECFVKEESSMLGRSIHRMRGFAGGKPSPRHKLTR